MSDAEFAQRLYREDQERNRRARRIKACEVVIPDGMTVGMIFMHDTEDHVRLQIEVPEGKGPGDRITIEYPMPMGAKKNTPNKAPKPCIVC